MQIHLTWPIKSADNREIAEIYLLVDLRVTQDAIPATPYSPPEGPEWVVEEVKINMGKWERRRPGAGKPRWIHDEAELPKVLEGPALEYACSAVARTEIAEQIQHGGYE